MPVDAVSNGPEAANVSQLTVDSGEKSEVRVSDEARKNHIRWLAGSDKHATMNDFQVQESVVQGVSQVNKVNRVQTLVGWFKCLKESIGIHEKKHDSYAAQAKNVKPRRRGMYTFLYGGRVDLNTFYDYKDLPQ